MADEILVREMTATAAEFRRALDFAFPDGVSVREGMLHVMQEGAAMEIALLPLPPRDIALLRLPRLSVHIRFIGGTLEQRQALLKRMDQAMQRGGG